MKTLFIALTIFSAQLTFGQDEKKNTRVPIVCCDADLTNYMGQLINLRGEVSNTKIPQIMGVDIRSDDPDLRGQEACATGILYSWTVKKAPEDPMTAHRGVGRFYGLKDPVTGELVQVQKVDE